MATSKSSLREYIPKFWICLKDYSLSVFKKDLFAGITVGIVALPLAMAFAIAAGLSPEKGLYTAIVAGFLISFLGGSRVQIGGPTGAFVIIIAGIIQREGYEGLVLATAIAAILVILAGICRLGTWIKFIPYPLVTGFTSGIAVIIFTSQIKDFLGLNMGVIPVNFLQQWSAYFNSIYTLDWTTTCISLGSLGTILAIRRFIPKLPWGIVAIILATVVCWVFHLPVMTLEDRFGEIPRVLPFPHLPTFHITLAKLQSLIPDALVIAFLISIESLLSAIVADGMTGYRHKSNCELIAQGCANLGSLAFMGIPATGAIARTATNIKSGAQTPIAGIIHALTLFFILLIFAPLVGKIPLAALSAVLIMVAWNMSEISSFRRLLKAPLGDVAVLLITFTLTVLIDLTIAVQVGVVLAAFLFIKRMSEMSSKIEITRMFVEETEEFPEKKDPDAIAKKLVPEGIEIYEINGPLFFGVADHLKDLLLNIEKPPKVFILRMRKVPIIDATGLHALKEFYYKCKKRNTTLILSGISGQPKESLQKYGLEKIIGSENIFPHIDLALQGAKKYIENTPKDL